jgi:hypothetical protein
MFGLPFCTCIPSVGRKTRIGFLLSWTILVGLFLYLLFLQDPYIIPSNFVMFASFVTLFLYLLHGLYTTITESSFLAETSTANEFLSSRLGALLSLFFFMAWIYILGMMSIAFFMGYEMTFDGETLPLWFHLLGLVGFVDFFGSAVYLITGTFQALKQLALGNRDKRIKLDDEMRYTSEGQNSDIGGYKLISGDTAV